jgi:demethylmenaquinone methyltransferase/2-methoxy-6-polyprenyl-1,4-benzoquinol methylase
MSTLVYMKILELSPARYDSWMRFLTLGRVDRLKAEIAEKWINVGDNVLEIGCGTGSLAFLMTERGANVTGIDISEKMLAEARKSVPNADFHHLTALEIDQFKGQGFNRIVATLSLSELSPDELDEVLRLAKDILKPGGLLIVADEVKTEKLWQQFLAALIRWPIAIITFLLTQQTTHVIKDFETKIANNHFTLIKSHKFLLGTMALFISKREKKSNVKLT